jgi:hypothetical protein
MIRLGSWFFCATFVSGAALLGCGGGGGGGGGGSSGAKTAQELVPRDNTISGWTVDPDNSKTAGMVAATATNALDTEALIDGAAADFFRSPSTPVEFDWQNYVNSSVTDAPDGATVVLYVLQMPSETQASGLYAALRSASLYTRKQGTSDDWVDPSSPLVGTDSRVQNTGDTWWINFYKGIFYVEVNLTPSQGPAPDYTPGNANTKVEAFRFAQAIAGKI